MQKVILFEGPEKVGKSTIAKMLSKDLNIPYFKFEKHKYWEEKRYELATYYDQPFQFELLKQTNYSIILDRGYPSEWVYSQVFKRKFDEDLIKNLDEMYSTLNTTIVICFKKKETIKDERVPVGKHNEILEKYFDFYRLTKCNVILLDTSSLDMHTQINFLKEHLNKVYNNE